MTNSHDRKRINYFKFNGISYKQYILYALQAFAHSTRKESVLLMMNDTTATALDFFPEYDVKFTLMCISHLDQLKAPLITLLKGRYIKCIILLLLLLTALA
jgi:hypothetical protein